MHEYSIARALIDRAEQEASRNRATSVAVLYLAIGREAGLEVDLLRTAFELASPGTRCAGARLEIRQVSPLWRCRACEGELPTTGPRRCARCGSAARLAQGGDLILERLELEVPDGIDDAGEPRPPQMPQMPQIPETQEMSDVRQLRLR